MTWLATARYGLSPAPGGLGFVQDLLNTQPAGRPRQPDLFDDLASAQGWADAALKAWSEQTGRAVPDVVLGEDDLDPLRRLRADLQACAGRHTTGADGDPAVPPDTPAVPRSAAAALRLGADGLVRLEPRGSGRQALASLALIAVVEAQGADTWRRLKACRNPRCQAAFFDRSRNNSAVWHDVRVCGNPANLRAHRARRRAEQN
ncbi:CGNR zinc finger domain-containing protein [Nonomuraea aridisoli]|uniref:Zinc finger CGNR domain-containing protein n=1 Tax=Nonomuraea aridisoli TaxID=2070368 RepID=A0A2W2E475_9ACTN|nr:CGNR zinc finger domain-containing protein [Nonomuraea aridisoli]PZG17081.1 hypothetical protein C1J01_19160 [Nonomuraea aridisoli]